MQLTYNIFQENYGKISYFGYLKQKQPQTEKIISPVPKGAHY